MSPPTPLWPLRCSCRGEEATRRRPAKVAKKTKTVAKVANKKESKKTASCKAPPEETIILEKKATGRGGEGKDYPKTIDACLHVKLTKELFVACGAEKPEHKATFWHKNNPLSQ